MEKLSVDVLAFFFAFDKKEMRLNSLLKGFQMKSTFLYNEIEILQAVKDHARSLLMVEDEQIIEINAEFKKDNSISVSFEIDPEEKCKDEKDAEGNDDDE